MTAHDDGREVLPWRPSNELERALLTAFEARNSVEYARLILSSALLVPDPPPPGTARHARLVEILPLDQPCVLAFTSPAALRWVTEDADIFGECRVLKFSEIADSWPGEQHQLLMDPLTPIGCSMTPDLLTKMADSEGNLFTAEDADRVIEDTITSTARSACLEGLTGEASAVGRFPLEHGPASELERSLASAIESGDSGAFLLALLDSEVIVPVQLAPSDSTDSATEPEDRALLFEYGGLRLIPLFSSSAGLRRFCAESDADSLTVGFIDILDHWPSADHILCLDPGLPTELFLRGDTVAELLDTYVELGSAGTPADSWS